MNEPISPKPVDLRHRFRRLRPGALETILEYQRTPSLALLPVILTGILSHYLPADTAATLTAQIESGGDTPSESGQAPALDVDSLTMLEIVLDLEDALGVEFDKPELLSIRTASELHAMLLRKIQAKGQPGGLSQEGPSETA